MSQSEPNPLREARFECGAMALHQMPAGDEPEVAFAGRSNAGKSSAINALAARRALARVSREPGRTREINFFALPGGGYLADLPGYGYARAAATLRERWARLMERYLGERAGLRGVVLFMDARREVGPEEQALIGWCARAGLPLRLVLTKSDKLSRGAAGARLRAARERAIGGPHFAVQLFSSRSGDGVAALREEVLCWLRDEAKENPGSGDRGEGN